MRSPRTKLLLTTSILTGLLLLAAVFSPAAAGDWPQWRGPDRDGITEGFTAPSPWPESPSERWRVEVGEGHSSPVVSGGRIYVQARRGEDEILLCLDAGTGETLWSQSHAVSYKVNQAAAGHGKGPKSTPVLSGGLIYTLAINGLVSAYETGGGALKWRRDFSDDYERTSPLYGAAMSPMVQDGRVVAHIGGNDSGALVALDAATGKTIWRWKGDGPGYASPILASLDGVRQIVTQTQTMIVGVAADSGRLLWSIPFETPWVQNIVTPVVHAGTVIVSGLEQGIFALRPQRRDGAWEAPTVWRNDDLSMYMSSPVMVEDRLCGFSHYRKGQFFCLDAGTGKARWTSDGRDGEQASLVAAGDLLLALTAAADLLVFRAGADSGAPIARYSVADTPTWAHPVPLGGDLLIKDKTTLARLSFARAPRTNPGKKQP